MKGVFFVSRCFVCDGKKNAKLASIWLLEVGLTATGEVSSN